MVIVEETVAHLDLEGGFCVEAHEDEKEESNVMGEVWGAVNLNGTGYPQRHKDSAGYLMYSNNLKLQ